MIEIGGYLELEKLICNEYHKDAIALNTARNALVYLAKSKNLSKVYLPYYLCDSVYKICDIENINYEFYHVDKDFMPIFDKKLNDNEYLYVVNYFGQLNCDKIISLHREYKNVIADNVQAFFDKPVDGVYTIYSCRKFFGVPDGAYLAGDVDKLPLDTDTSGNRMRHLLGRFESGKASDYYADFQANDEMFETLPVMYMSDLTHNILGAVDYDKVIKKRNENWKILHNALSETNGLDLISPNSPYMYPYYHKNGAQIRKKLIEGKVYIPTLWPNVMGFDGCELEKDYVQNILPLPIDQRYGECDMNAIIKQIKSIKGV